MYNKLFVGTTLLQLLLLNRYFSVLFPASDKSRHTILLSYILTGGIIYVSTISFFPVFITGLISIGSTFVIASLSQAGFASRLIFSILYLILGFIAESVSFYFISGFQFAKETSGLSQLEVRLMILLFSTFIMGLFILAIKYIKRGSDYKIGTAYYYIMVCIILASLLVLNTLFFYSEKNLFYILSVISVLFINILIVYLFDRVIEKFRLADENNLLQKQMDYQDNNYEKTVNSFKSIKRIIHDTNKQVLYIGKCIQENRLQEANQHINKMLDVINTSYQSVATGNLVIDALVSNALNVANDNRITMKHTINVIAEEIKIDRYDLCILIGNILDNAIEATQLIPKIEDKLIDLRIFSTNNTLFIHVINSRRDSIDHVQRTNKKNPDFHGIGLTNIQRVAKKYGGHLKIETRAKQFETIIMLPLG
ncbi:GHKL domain-containing protein [Paenibacillus sp. BR2-3]|uniref:sensor histidine kinase n=1 Tax=Paenibacillus sp. BR2-3 TaxID=3048494 RepID=UPI0039773FEA